MTWMFDLPLIVAGPLVMFLLLGFSLGGLYLFRRHLLPRLRFEQHEATFGAGMVSSIMVFYGLSAALVAVNVWDQYKQVGSIASRETTALNLLWRDVGGYPGEFRVPLQKRLREYTYFVIHEAWPLQRKGVVPSRGLDQMTQFQAILTSFEPRTEAQKILAAETFRSYNHLIEIRRERLDSVNAHLPGVFWAVLIFGAIISLISAFFFPIVDGRVHAAQTALLAVFIGLVIFLILALDRPYRGDLGVTAEPYQLLYDQLMKS
ncbi:MAG TPA: DUF4239 domain-containing protein [Candidatus Eisenbacteria bacterium]|nr:DUF4239 domain-containing protein [Candidatus Eisenbacteria bacterium]